MFINMTRRSGSGNGTGLSRTALTTEKMAVFAPMPSASAATAASVNAEALAEHAKRVPEVLQKRFHAALPEQLRTVLSLDGAI